MADEPAVAAFINGLDRERRRTLYQRMTREFRGGQLLRISPTSLTGTDAAALRSFTSFHVTRTGKWWADRITCYTFGERPCVAHLRWQPRVAGVQIKLFTHIVGWASATCALLPSNLGGGTSIDHLCGSKGCHKPEHLQLATRHADNIARIGCQGVLLLVRNNHIVQELPCSHAPAGTHEERVLLGCQRVRVVTISDDAMDRMTRV